MKLTEENEKVRTLEAQLAWSKDQVIEDFKKSSEFDNILNEEYDANMPETFTTYWESVVEEIRKTIPEVTLKAFPIPSAAGSEGPSGVSDTSV